MWPVLIRGSNFSSIRSSALLPSDQPSNDIFPSPDDNHSSVNIEKSDNNNNKDNNDYGVKLEKSSTAVATTIEEISPPARRCEMLSIRELTSNDSSPDSTLSQPPPYSSWESRTSPPANKSTFASAPDRYVDYSYMDPSFVLTDSGGSHEITDDTEEYNEQQHHQRYQPLHHQDYDHHQPMCNNQWHEKATSTATTSANSSKKIKTRKKRSISTSSASSSSSLSSSSNADTDKEEDDQRQERTTTIAKTINSGSKRKAQNMDDRPFACPLCERRFNRRYNLNAHIRIHDPHRKKLFDCPVCTQSFDRKHDRDRHVDALHFENKRRALCHLCDASFTRRDALTRHMHKLHTRPTS